MTGVVDPAFKGVGQKPGLKIWRIEKMNVVSWPEKDYGYFFEGDSYIVLHTKKEKGGQLSWSIHFWLGKDTSQDEAGVCAIKTVELDDALGGGPVQCREVQAHESQQFLSYFKDGIMYKPGGMATGFKHVDRDFHENRMLKVKGKRTPRISEVPIGWKSLNKGDVFILDLGTRIIQWNGSQANYSEKLKGTQTCQRIRDSERGGRAQIVVIEENDRRYEHDFLEVMGERTPIADAGAGDDDSAFERNVQAQTKMYKVSDQSGSLVLTEIATRPLSQSNLESNDCFIIDQGAAGVWVWKGKQATKAEKDRAFENAMNFITAKKYPKHTKCTAVIENAEPASFKGLFKNWRDKGATTGLGKTHTRGKIADSNTVQTKFDAATLHADPQRAAQSKMVDDGTGNKEIWRIDNFDKVPLEKNLYGQFFGGDCYVIKYTYLVNNKENYIIYYWQGLDSTADEKGTSALMAVQLDDEVNGAAVQIRQVMGKECSHFLAMFQGKLIIHKGGKASSFTNTSQKDKSYQGGVRMFQVRGTSELCTKAYEVDPVAASLNSNDVFVAQTPKNIYLWCGKGCSGDERELAKQITKAVSSREHTTVPEGQEPTEFWTALGGKAPYASTARMQESDTDRPPRLFQCSNASGGFRVEEVFDFTQEDLIEDDVMLLDTWDEIFIWVGKGANDTEKKESVNTAREYISTDPSGRDSDTPLICVKQGFEPPTFTGWFMAWDNDKWSGGKTYEEIKAELGEQNAGVTVITSDMKTGPSGGGAGAGDPANYKKYSLEELQQEELPLGVDATKKEYYLSEEDFKRLFGCDFSTYNGKPNWKKNDMKKKAGLF
uniref:Villin-1-like isoform X2 n=1 Tax=Saccoglossus kowalevskii TaxID=10224 RepID=A0ABM0MGT9_SACKO|nr:PREDICTED: villin-1-like isoform X2 [Saccoglossus kowalevskii]